MVKCLVKFTTHYIFKYHYVVLLIADLDTSQSLSGYTMHFHLLFNFQFHKQNCCFSSKISIGLRQSIQTRKSIFKKHCTEIIHQEITKDSFISVNEVWLKISRDIFCTCIMPWLDPESLPCASGMTCTEPSSTDYPYVPL